MAAQKKYPDELRERAVKMVLEIREREGKGHGELARVARQRGAMTGSGLGWGRFAAGRVMARSVRTLADQADTAGGRVVGRANAWAGSDGGA